MKTLAKPSRARGRILVKAAGGLIWFAMTLQLLGAAHCAPGDFSLPEAKLGDGFGFNTHAEVSRNGPMLMESAGAQFVRQSWTWSSVEGSRGSYDWTHIDQMMDQLEGTKLRVIAILDGNNPAYGRRQQDGLTPGEDWDGFLRFVQAAVSRYRGRGIIWELWNEPNLDNFWGPKADPEAYSRLSHDVRHWFSLNAQKELLVNGGLSPGKNNGIPYDAFLKVLVSKGCLKDWDAFAFHPYCIDPAEARVQWDTIKRIVGPDVKLIATEQGYSWKWLKDWGWVGTSWGRFKGIDVNDETKQRQAVAKLDLEAYRINVQEGVRITIIYDWPDTDEHMGFMTSDGRGLTATAHEKAGLNVFRDYFRHLRAGH